MENDWCVQLVSEESNSVFLVQGSATELMDKALTLKQSRRTGQAVLMRNQLPPSLAGNIYTVAEPWNT